MLIKLTFRQLVDSKFHLIYRNNYLRWNDLSYNFILLKNPFYFIINLVYTLYLLRFFFFF